VLVRGRDPEYRREHASTARRDPPTTTQLPRLSRVPLSEPTPEQVARQQIDAHLIVAGWAVQDYKQFNAIAIGNLRQSRAALRQCDLPFQGYL
jgi:hypothetical protein